MATLRLCYECDKEKEWPILKSSRQRAIAIGIFARNDTNETEFVLRASEWSNARVRVLIRLCVYIQHDEPDIEPKHIFALSMVSLVLYVCLWLFFFSSYFIKLSGLNIIFVFFIFFINLCLSHYESGFALCQLSDKFLRHYWLNFNANYGTYKIYLPKINEQQQQTSKQSMCK